MLGGQSFRETCKLICDSRTAAAAVSARPVSRALAAASPGLAARASAPAPVSRGRAAEGSLFAGAVMSLCRAMSPRATPSPIFTSLGRAPTMGPSLKHTASTMSFTKSITTRASSVAITAAMARRLGKART